MNKLQKKVMIFLIVLTLLTPLGILLPMAFNANEAWGEWSAETVKGLIGYVPEGLQKYTHAYKAPLTGYSVNSSDNSTIHKSVYYMLSGIVGAAATLGVTLFISKIIIKK